MQLNCFFALACYRLAKHKLHHHIIYDIHKVSNENFHTLSRNAHKALVEKKIWNVKKASARENFEKNFSLFYLKT